MHRFRCTRRSSRRTSRRSRPCWRACWGIFAAVRVARRGRSGGGSACAVRATHGCLWLSARAPARAPERATRLSWARRLSVRPTAQAFTTSFMRFARPASGSSLTVFDPIASKIGCARSRASAGTGREHHEPAVLGRLPGADHGRVHKRDPVVLREPGGALDVRVHAGLEPHGAVRHRLRRLPHYGQDRGGVGEHRDHERGGSGTASAGVSAGTTPSVASARAPCRACGSTRVPGSPPSAGCGAIGAPIIPGAREPRPAQP